MFKRIELLVPAVTPFVARLLRHASKMIDPSPERDTWYYGEWQSAYENLDKLASRRRTADLFQR